MNSESLKSRQSKHDGKRCCSFTLWFWNFKKINICSFIVLKKRESEHRNQADFRRWLLLTGLAKARGIPVGECLLPPRRTLVRIWIQMEAGPESGHCDGGYSYSKHSLSHRAHPWFWRFEFMCSGKPFLRFWFTTYWSSWVRMPPCKLSSLLMSSVSSCNVEQGRFLPGTH